MAYNQLPYTTSTIGSSLSISPQGRIGFTRFFMSIHNIGPDTRARLYLDDSKRSMVIEFTDDDDATAYPIAAPKNGGGYINGIKFFQQANLNLEDFGKRYPYKQVTGKSVGLSGAKRDVFEVDLAHPVTSQSKDDAEYQVEPEA